MKRNNKINIKTIHFLFNFVSSLQSPLPPSTYGQRAVNSSAPAAGPSWTVANICSGTWSLLLLLWPWFSLCFFSLFLFPPPLLSLFLCDIFLALSQTQFPRGTPMVSVWLSHALQWVVGSVCVQHGAAPASPHRGLTAPRPSTWAWTYYTKAYNLSDLWKSNHCH